MRRPLASDRRLTVWLAAAGIFLAGFGLLHTWFWTRYQIIDWPTYELYGRAIVRGGLVPYRDFPVEYPPGALAVFIAPVWAAKYSTAFAGLMAIFGIVTCGIVAAVRPVAAFFVALTPILAGSLFLSRFDEWPVMLAVAAVALLLADRDGWGWALLGAAVAAKLWPAVLVPLALVWSIRRGRGIAVLSGGAVAAAAFVPFALLAPGGLWHSISGQGSRPLQVESLGASLLTTFAHPTIVSSHGSQNIAGYSALGAASAAVQVVVLAALWLAFSRGPLTAERLVRYSAASICAFIAFGKVLSPQFLLWLVPFVPLVRGRRGLAASGLLVAAFVLTQIWFPLRYFRYVATFHLAGVVLARDLVLVALLAVLALPQARVSRR